jgi:pimeloyl-ACP methyl ester carboxylesterase
VLLVHSSGLAGSQWKRTVAALSPSRLVLVPDLWGSGQSQPWQGQGAFTVEADLALLAAVAEPYERLDVVGHSYGGLLALHLALRLGPRVRSLAVFEPVALSVLRDGDAAAQQGWEALQTPMWTDERTGGSAAWVAKFVEYWSGEGGFQRLPAAVQAQFIQAGPTVFRQVQAAHHDTASLDTYAALTCPFLAFRGGASTATAAAIHRLLVSRIAGAKEVVLEGAPHMGPMTHAREFNAALQAFYAALPE